MGLINIFCISVLSGMKIRFAVPLCGGEKRSGNATQRILRKTNADVCIVNEFPKPRCSSTLHREGGSRLIKWQKKKEKRRA